MKGLTLQRCLHHPVREAVARCPDCANFFCRECTIEHDGRVICAGCRRKVAQRKEKRAALVGRVLGGVQVGASVLVLWICFFLLGKMLLAIPASFHEGEVWENFELAE